LALVRGAGRRHGDLNGLTAVGEPAAAPLEDAHARGRRIRRVECRDVLDEKQTLARLQRHRRIDRQQQLDSRVFGIVGEPPGSILRRIVQRHSDVADVEQLDILRIRRAGGIVHDLVDHNRADLRFGVGLSRRRRDQRHEVAGSHAVEASAQRHALLRWVERLLFAVAGLCAV